MASSSKDISTPFIGTRKGSAISLNIHINKCLGKLRSFIEEHHAGDEYIFWPDSAPSHYAYEITQWPLQEKIKFVAKQINLANVRKARSIEDFWSILACKVDEGVWEAKRGFQLKTRIYQKVKQIDMRVVQHRMTNIRTKLRKIKKHFL